MVHISGNKEQAIILRTERGKAIMLYILCLLSASMGRRKKEREEQ